MLEQLTPILTSTASAVFLAVVVFLFKLPGVLKKNTEAVEKLTGCVAELTDMVHMNEKRHDVADRLLSDVLHHPIDTEQISKDFSKYPPAHIFHKPKRRDS